MGPFVHKTLTHRWALEEGLSEELAMQIAEADADFDLMYPGRLMPFWHLHLGPVAWLLGRIRIETALRLRIPRLLGWGLHGVQDYFAHGWLGEKHLLLRMGIARRHPDKWEDAPDYIQGHIERSTRHHLRRYARVVEAISEQAETT